MPLISSAEVLGLLASFVHVRFTDVCQVIIASATESPKNCIKPPFRQQLIRFFSYSLATF